MSELRRPVPKPRPAPGRPHPTPSPIRSSPTTGPFPVAPSSPSPGPPPERPTPASTPTRPSTVPMAKLSPVREPPVPPLADDEDREPESPAELLPAELLPARSRAQRLRAERKARRLRLQRVLQVTGGALAIVVVISVVLALTSGGGGNAAHSAAPRPTGTATAANLEFPVAATAFLGSAASDIAAVTTYDYRRLDDALNAGLAVTTGTYREQYRLALTGDLARTATAEHVVHTFEVLDVGLGAMTTTQARVLVFGQERVTDDTTGPSGRVTPITLTATIKHIGNRYLISDLVQDGDPGLPPGGPDLAVAVDAARTEVVNTLSYRRSDFPDDLQHALDGATSPLREQLQSSAPDVRAAMTAGNYDMSGTVSETAVVRADPETVTLMIAAEQTRTVDGASQPTVIQHRYEVTVTRTETGWAASRISSVDGDA